MSATQKLGVLNHVATAVAVTGTTTAAGYPWTNLRDSTRPRLTGRTTGIGATTIQIDLGSAKLIELVVLGDANFASASFQFDNDTGFGGGDVVDTGLLAMAINEWAGRGK